MNYLLTGLLLLFVALKLMGFIDWPWWIVTAPFWVPLVIAGLILAGVLIARRFESPQQRAARMLKEYADALSKHRG